MENHLADVKLQIPNVKSFFKYLQTNCYTSNYLRITNELFRNYFRGLSKFSICIFKKKSKSGFLLSLN